MLQIGNLKLKNNVILAPMAGYTDLSFRLLVKKISGCGLVCSEMISSEGLIRENKNTSDLLLSEEEERPVSFQIFGSRPDVMADAAAILEERGADIVDLNFGCPEQKIVRAGSGAALLKNTTLMFSVIKKVRKKIKIPLTIKIRSGWDENGINALKIAKESQDLGVDGITVHPRTRNQFFRGHSNWEIIGEVKAGINIPVIGSGDIVSVEDAFLVVKSTGCDGVMIGRGVLGKPWFLKEVDMYLRTGKKTAPPSMEKRLDIMLQHLKLACCYKDKTKAIREMRKFLPFYLKGISGARSWRKELMGVTFLDDFKSFIERIKYEKV